MTPKNPSDDKLIADYLDGLLPPKVQAAFEARLKSSPTLRKAVDEMRALREKAREATASALPPEAKLRLYERLNAERARRGEPLLRIPQELLALAKAKAIAAGKAATEVASASANAAQTAAQAGAATVQTAAQSAKQAARQMQQTGKTALTGSAETLKTGIQATTDAASTLAETTEVLDDIAEKPLKGALTAPPKVAAKVAKAGLQAAHGAAKTGAKMAQTGAKVAAESAKSAAEMAKGGLKTTLTAAKGAAQTAKAGAQVLGTAAAGAKEVARAKKETEAEDADAPDEN